MQSTVAGFRRQNMANVVSKLAFVDSGIASYWFTAFQAFLASKVSFLDDFETVIPRFTSLVGSALAIMGLGIRALSLKKWWLGWLNHRWCWFLRWPGLRKCWQIARYVLTAFVNQNCRWINCVLSHRSESSVTAPSITFVLWSLKLEQVTLRCPTTRPALSGISFDIEAGEIVADKPGRRGVVSQPCWKSLSGLQLIREWHGWSRGVNLVQWSLGVCHWCFIRAACRFTPGIWASVNGSRRRQQKWLIKP